MELQFVTAKSGDFRALAAQLDAYYFELVGDIQLRYAEPNRPENMDALAVVYENGQPIACGAWKAVDGDTAELKRIFVLPEHRRRGIASRMMQQLESHAAYHGYRKMILETATTTADSQKLYLSQGYRRIDYYGSPAGAENCMCFIKEL